MVVDLGLLERAIADARDALDHRFLDEINDLGPATMENLSRWIWCRLAPEVENLFKVSIYRDSSGEACSYWGEELSA
jgi:6-pyruvoyltetrahydropterin/6-carboxytetrahydropterin synthase